MTIKEIFPSLVNKLQTITKTPELDARLIISSIFKCSANNLLLRLNQQLTSEEINKIDSLLKKRMSGYPMAYILGYKEFYGRNFIVNKNVLIPRPETENIIDTVIKINKKTPLNTILDIGTGSGCIAITLALELPNTKIYASDISKKALQVTEKNAIIYLGKGYSNLSLEYGNLLEPFYNLNNLDLIIANLPYLDKNQYTDDSIKKEPYLALYSEKNGLDHYIKLINFLKNHLFLLPKYLLIEVNPEQVQFLTDVIYESISCTEEVNVIKDLRKQDRHILVNLRK